MGCATQSLIGPRRNTATPRHNQGCQAVTPTTVFHLSFQMQASIQATIQFIAQAGPQATTGAATSSVSQVPRRTAQRLFCALRYLTATVSTSPHRPMSRHWRTTATIPSSADTGSADPRQDQSAAEWIHEPREKAPETTCNTSLVVTSRHPRVVTERLGISRL